MEFYCLLDFINNSIKTLFINKNLFLKIPNLNSLIIKKFN